MADPYREALEREIERVIQQHTELLEEWCEKSLVDPEGRGVLLIWDRYPTDLRIGLSEDVPWGEIYEVREATTGG